MQHQPPLTRVPAEVQAVRLADKKAEIEEFLRLYERNNRGLVDAPPLLESSGLRSAFGPWWGFASLGDRYGANRVATERRD